MSVFEKWYTYTKPILKDKSMSMDDIILVFTRVEEGSSSFNWISNKPGIRAIVIKAGDIYYKYVYTNNETSGSKVSSIDIDETTNKPYKITQVQVLCYDVKNNNNIFGLVVPSLTCSSSYVRHWSWLAEHMGPSDTIIEDVHEDVIFGYKIKYTPSWVDSKSVVTGNIVIHNNSPENITVSGINIDSDGNPSSVSILNLLLPIIVYPGSSISWTYKITYSNFVSNGLVTLTSYISNQNSISQNETVSTFTMSEPTEEYGRIGSIYTWDNSFIPEKLIDAKDGIYIYSYDTIHHVDGSGSRFYIMDNNITWDINPGVNYTFPVRTTLLLKLRGYVVRKCTFTTEYWKTHNKYSPNTNQVWGYYVNEDDMFYRTGRTWYQTLMLDINTSTIFQKISVEYIAAMLNSYKGADTNVIYSELHLFNLYFQNPYYMSTSRADTYYNKLKLFNAGLIGFGSCIL